MVKKFGKAQVPVDLEAEALIKGQGKYTDDLAPSDALWGAFLRSPVAHGRIAKLDTSAADEAPDVVAVITAKTLAGLGFKPNEAMEPLVRLDAPPIELPPLPRYALAVDKVRHVGEPIALVVATSMSAAQDAVELIELEIDPLTPHTLLQASSGEDAVWDFVPNNQYFVWQAGDPAAVEKALGEAAHRVSVSAQNQRLSANSLEPRSVIASYDADKDFYTVYSGTQGTTNVRKGLAEALNVAPEQVRVISFDVGGSFGMKAYHYPEDVAIAGASKILGRTVRWTATRSEALVSDAHGRASELSITGAFDKDGSLTAIQVDIQADLGAYVVVTGHMVQSLFLGACIAGPYRTPNVFITTNGILTNTSPTGAYRGAGRPEATFLLERMMDKAARELGIDRVDIRNRNLVQHADMPYTNPLGLTYDSGDFPAVLARALEESDWAGFDDRRKRSEAEGRYRGIACSVFLEMAGAYFEEPAAIEVGLDGKVHLLIAGVANGQRHVSTFTHVASERLGVDIGSVDIVFGDSARTIPGPPSVGSRAAMMTGSAVAQAIDEAIERGRIIVGQLAKGHANDIEYAAGRYTVLGTGETFDFVDIPRRVAEFNRNGGNIPETLDGSTLFMSKGPTWPNGGHVCEVEVDPETGAMTILNYVAVDDCGTVLNPPVVEGQLIGGVAQGLGQAIMEHHVYDESGQMLTGSFMDYAMPRASDMPAAMEAFDQPVPTTNNVVGAKGAGESGTIGGLVTVVNAALDAVSQTGVRDIEMPLTSNRIWQALQKAAGTNG